MSDAPHTILTIGGKERRFRFDMNAVADFQGVTGIKLTELDTLENRVNENVGVLTALIWAGIFQYDDKLTVRSVGRMFTYDEVERLNETVWTHVSAALGSKKAKKAERAAPKKTTLGNRGRGSSPSKNQRT